MPIVKAFAEKHPEVRGPANLFPHKQHELFALLRGKLEREDQQGFWTSLEAYKGQTVVEEQVVQAVTCPLCQQYKLHQRHGTANMLVHCNVCGVSWLSKRMQGCYYECSRRDGTTSSCGAVLCQRCKGEEGAKLLAGGHGGESTGQVTGGSASVAPRGHVAGPSVAGP